MTDEKRLLNVGAFVILKENKMIKWRWKGSIDGYEVSGLTDWEESFMIIYNLIALNKPLMWR